MRAIKAKYKETTLEQAKAMLHTIPIIHLYGKLGSLLGHSDDDDPIVPYGAMPDEDGNRVLLCDSIDKASTCIRTIHEEYAQSDPNFVKARKLISEAQRVYLLGFGYLEENMKRLFTEPGERDFNLLIDQKNHRHVNEYKFYGTAHGLSVHVRRRLSHIGLMGENSHTEIDSPFPDAMIYDFLDKCRYSTLD